MITGDVRELPGRVPWLTQGALRAPRSALLAIACVTLIGGAWGLLGLERLGPFTADHPGSETVKTRTLLGQATGVDPDFSLIARVASPDGARGPVGQARARRVAATLARDPLVPAVRGYPATRGTTLISRDGHASYVIGGLSPAPLANQLAAARRLTTEVQTIPGVTLGGRAVFYAEGNDIARRDLVHAEAWTLLPLALLCLWVFRGLAAALLPGLIGATTVLVALAALRLASQVTEVSIYAVNIVTALGLGLAVDYSLLLLSRYREEALASGYGTRALYRAFARTGPTVLFSCATVAAATLSLAVFPQPFLRSIAFSGALVALLAGLAALTLLPAVLLLAGPRIEWGTPPRWRAAARRAAHPSPNGGWYQLSQTVMRHPWPIALTAAALLLVLALPARGVKTTTVDANVLPPAAASRQVFEALERDGRRNPIIVAAAAPGARPVTALARRIDALPATARVSAPRRAGQASDGTPLWRIDALPAAAEHSAASERLVRRIRGLDPGYRVWVGGETAGLVDLKRSLLARLPLALVCLLSVAFALIWWGTRSPVLAFKALIMNALSGVAALGVLVWIFEHGRGEDLLGYTSSGGLEPSVLVLLFAVAFGLSTDYGMFLLGRIREYHDRGASDREAIALGVERTGRVVTRAALLLCVAFGALIFARHALIKEVGVGCAVAVVLDATLVRALLVPATMRILGHVNWWSPPRPRLLGAGRGVALTLPAPAVETPASESLAATRYCDVEHPAIKALVAELLDGRESKREAAIKLFEWVRDHVRYEFGPWGVPASQTLTRHVGTCTNKSNLLVALLRAAGIPAAYGVMRVDAQHYFGVIGPKSLSRYASRDSTHTYTAAFLDGAWRRCDPSTDADLAMRTGHWCAQTRLVQWDGHHDALDCLDPAHVHADLGLQPDIDVLLDKPARNATRQKLKLANEYLAFIRGQPAFDSAEQLLEAYGSAVEVGLSGETEPPLTAAELATVNGGESQRVGERAERRRA